MKGIDKWAKEYAEGLWNYTEEIHPHQQYFKENAEIYKAGMLKMREKVVGLLESFDSVSHRQLAMLVKAIGEGNTEQTEDEKVIDMIDQATAWPFSPDGEHG